MTSSLVLCTLPLINIQEGAPVCNGIIQIAPNHRIGPFSGWLWGEGEATDDIRRCQKILRGAVVRVFNDDITEHTLGNVKFIKGEIIASGELYELAEYISKNLPFTCPHRIAGWKCIGRRLTVGDNSIAIVGDGGEARAGKRGTARAGNFGGASAGFYGEARVGRHGKAITGHGGRSYAGVNSIANSGEMGFSQAESYGIATTGDYGKSLVSGEGTAQSGENGTLIFEWADKAVNLWRTTVAHVGEDGIKPNTPYHCVDGKIKEGKSPYEYPYYV